MKKFNLNDHIHVQIKQEGWEHLIKTVGKDFIKHCIESRKVIIDNETWYKLQANVVFDLFTINYGFSPLINVNIMFDDNDLENVDIKINCNANT